VTKLEDFVKHPLAIVCHDAGAANLIVEWLKDYKGDLNPCMVGPAKIIWEKHFPGVKLTSVNKAINDSKTLLSGTGWGDVEYSARIKAKKIGIQNIAVIDHWTNYRERFIRDENEVLPDVIIVSDKYAYNQAQILFPSISVIELPNNYLQVESKLACSERHRECKDPFENILIIAEPLRQKKSGKDTYLEFDAIEFFMKSLNKINISSNHVHIVLRLHPSEALGKYDSILKKYQHLVTKINISKNTNLYSDIAWADLVVGMNSYALVVSMHAKIPTMSILPPGSDYFSLPFKKIMHLRDNLQMLSMN
jgi:hypothetical protein